MKGLFSCPFCMNIWISWASFYSEAGAGAAHPAQAGPCISRWIPPHVCETSEFSVQAHVGSCPAHLLLSLIYEQGQRIFCSISPDWNGFWPQCFQTWGPEHVTSAPICMRANCGITERSEEVQPQPKTYRGQWEGTLGMLLGCGCWKHWTQKNAVEGFCSCHLAAGSLCVSPFCFLKTSPSWYRMPVGGGSSESLKKQLRNGAFPNELCHQNQPPSSRELWKYWGKSGSICKHGEPEEIRSINNLSWTLHPLLSLSNPPWANQQLCSSVKADTVCAFCGVMWWPLIDFGHGLAVRAGYLGRAITSTCNHPGQWPRQVVLQQSLDTFLHAASVLQLSSSFGRISSAALKHLLAGNEASWPFNLGFQGFGYLWWSFGWIFLWKR